MSTSNIFSDFGYPHMEIVKTSPLKKPRQRPLIFPSKVCSARHAAKSWDEIGAEMGITAQRAQQIFENGIRKLRHKPETMRKLFALAMEKDAMRGERSAL